MHSDGYGLIVNEIRFSLGGKFMPDMRVKEYISVIQEEIDRCVKMIEDKFVELGNDAAKEVYSNGIEYAKIEARIQTLTEVQNDLKSRLEEAI